MPDEELCNTILTSKGVIPEAKVDRLLACCPFCPSYTRTSRRSKRMITRSAHGTIGHRGDHSTQSRHSTICDDDGGGDGGVGVGGGGGGGAGGGGGIRKIRSSSSSNSNSGRSRKKLS